MQVLQYLARLTAAGLGTCTIHAVLYTLTTCIVQYSVGTSGQLLVEKNGKNDIKMGTVTDLVVDY